MLNPTPVIKSQVMQRINQPPAAKVWTPVDFLDLGSRDAVDKMLQRLVASNDLRRIDRGLYDQPRMNALTGQPSAGNGERRVVVQSIAVNQDGTRVPAVECQCERYLHASTTTPKFSPGQRLELFSRAVELTLQRELKH